MATGTCWNAIISTGLKYPMEEILLLGDFNMSDLQWTYDIEVPGFLIQSSININLYEVKFLSLCYDNCLVFTSDEPIF